MSPCSFSLNILNKAPIFPVEYDLSLILVLPCGRSPILSKKTRYYLRPTSPTVEICQSIHARSSIPRILGLAGLNSLLGPQQNQQKSGGTIHTLCPSSKVSNRITAADMRATQFPCDLTTNFSEGGSRISSQVSADIILSNSASSGSCSPSPE